MTVVECKDCHLNEVRCDYCYFHGTEKCPEYKENYPSSNYFHGTEKCPEYKENYPSSNYFNILD